MPITQADLQSFIDPSLIPNYQLPSYNVQGAQPTTGGTQPRRSGSGAIGGALGLPNFNPISGNKTSGIASDLSNPLINPQAFIDPIGTGILSSLFSDGPPPFQPYVNAEGKYVFGPPSRINPVPLANVPGAHLSPSAQYQKTAGNVQAIYDLLPYLNAAVNQGAVPSAIAQLQASQATSPGYADLMTKLYNTYGPQLNAIGNEILNRNALAQANTENQVLTGPGTDLVKNAYGLSQVYDKPYYDTRAQAAGRMSDLLNSIDLSGKLSTTENNQIAQGLARQNVQSGTLNAPSASNAVSNAMQYGQAGYARKQQAISNLSDALSKASAFLPASKSGVDVFQVATGRPSQANPGAAQFTGVNTATSTGQQGGFGLAGSTLGNMTQSYIAQMQMNAQKKDWLDQFNQFASGLGSL